MGVQIEGDINISGIKRCYIEDVGELEIECECGESILKDLEDDYLFSYPQVGTIETLYFYCDKCDSEYELPIGILSARIKLEYDLKELKKL